MQSRRDTDEDRAEEKWLSELGEWLREVDAELGGHLTKEQLLAIDLTQYDELDAYVDTGIDWALERQKILFLQVTLENLPKYPWDFVVHCTRPYFGQLLPPPVAPPAVTPVAGPLVPPFDSRQTPEHWATLCDTALQEYRESMLRQIRDWFQAQLDSGVLKKFDRPRKSVDVGGLRPSELRRRLAQKKAPIADEREATLWASIYFFRAQMERPVSWAELADGFPLPNSRNGGSGARNAAKRKRVRAEQIRRRVVAILNDLGLPMPQ